MLINRNTLGHLEDPDFILCKASEERIGVLQCTAKKWEHKFNDLDVLTFEIPYLTDGENTPFYDQIDVMKYVEVLTVGRFSIKDIEIHSEGQKNEYKSVTCQSYECGLAQRYLEEFAINLGTTGSIDNVRFYQPGNQAYSLLHLAVGSLFPEWSFGHIDAALWTMKRSFEITRQDVYSFLMDDVATAFECIFTFDTLSKTINAYQDTNYGKDTNVHLSYNTLLEATNLSYSTDEIKTALKLEGEDNLNVREINMGYDYIYDFSYYADESFMSSSLLSAYNTWQNLILSAVDLNLFTYKAGVITRAELSGKSYKDAYTLLLTKYQNYYTDISRWSSTLIPYLFNTRYIGYGTISYTEDGSDAVTFEKQTSTVLVDSLPSSGDASTLYLVKYTNNMYRWNGSWFNVNEWRNCCLNALKEKQAAAANAQSVAMKAGYGNPDDLNETHKLRYVDTYLPATYQYNALTKQIEVVNNTLSTLKDNQAIIQTDKTVITNKTAMKNNFTTAQLKELSTFIREDELKADNYIVTDIMTEKERFDMLYDMLAYGQKELAKKAMPEIQFSVDMMNLYALKEFDDYSGDFDLANYVWVTLRDDYSIKAKILEVSVDFLDQSYFEVTFGNIARQARNIFTDITEAMNTATSAATSVSFGASNWSAAAEQTDSIGQALADGLLSQSYYLANAADNETRIDSNGVWITTTTDPTDTTDEYHGRDNTDNYDAIYLGGGRILFTEDGWRTVSMSVGRAEVNMPSIVDGQIVFKRESKFGTFADFLIAGYIGGSIIVGGDIYSDGYTTSSDKNSGNYGTHLDLKEGTFEFNSPQSFKKSDKPGKKRLRLYTDNDVDVLEVNGVIHAKEGNIGSDDNGAGGFIIKHEKLYMDKESFNDGKNGVYIGFDSRFPSTKGISLGIYNGGTKRNPFSVDVTGYLTSTSGYIGGFNIDDKKLYYGTKTSFDSNAQGVYIGFDVDPITHLDDDTKKGISLGKYNSSTNKSPFSVDVNGKLHAEYGEIGGFTLTHNSIYKDKSSMDSTADGIYIGNDGIALRSDNRFMVDTVRDKAKIAGFDFTSTSIYKDKTGINDMEHDGIYIGTDGIALKKDNRFMVDVRNNQAKIAGFNFTNTSIYSGKETLGDNTTKGIFIGPSGISLQAHDNSNRCFYVDVQNQTAEIAGFHLTRDSMYTGSKNGIYAAENGLFIGTSGISFGNDNRIILDASRNEAKIAGFKFTNTYLSTNDKDSLYDTNHQGVYIGNSGISLGNAIQDGETTIYNPFYVTSSGHLFAKYGEIGDIYLRSNGLRAKNNNWYINADGTASFNHITISEWASINGVQYGSHFGSIGYDDGVTWGSFDGYSYYGCNDDIEPFSGGASLHIQSLALSKLTAEWIEGDYIKASLLTASNIQTGTLDASVVTVTNIDASNINTGTLSAERIDAANLQVSGANVTGTLSAGKIRLNGHEVTGTSGYIFNGEPTGWIESGGTTVHFSNISQCHIMGYYGD